MKYIDIADSKRVDRHPDKIIQVVSDGTTVENGYKIKNVQLRLYNEKNDEKLGPYSLITSLVETDKGSVEMIYDEGFRGNDALETSSKFLKFNLVNIIFANIFLKKTFCLCLDLFCHSRTASAS